MNPVQATAPGVPVSLAACHAAWQRARRLLEHGRDPRAAAQVPAHKRLRHAATGCGLPVGNLKSQFYANVYLDPLDQFVKHRLKVRHYVRYADNLVLLGESDEQLRQWQREIECSAQDQLGLAFRPGALPRPCVDGIYFPGHVVFVHQRRVRQDLKPEGEQP